MEVIKFQMVVVSLVWVEGCCLSDVLNQNIFSTGSNLIMVMTLSPGKLKIHPIGNVVHGAHLPAVACVFYQGRRAATSWGHT